MDYPKVNSENAQLLQAIIDDEPSYTEETHSRNAEILKSIINGTEYTEPPQSEIEELLLELKEHMQGDVVIVPLSVTSNGTYTAPSGKAYTPVTVEVQPPEDSYQLKSITTPTPLATFEASAMPMPSLKVSVEAKQDLHGYDKPWVGGAGKNKYDKNNANNQPNKRVSTGSGGTYAADGYTATYLVEVKPDTDYTLTTSSNFVSYICWYDETQTRIGGTNWSSGTSKTSPSNAKYVRFDFNTADIDKVQLEQGTTATSYEPYSNICPISGWDAANISDVGKNLFDKDNADILTGKALNPQTGLTYNTSTWSVSNYIEIEPSTTYTLNTIPSGNNAFAFYDSDKAYISGDTSFGTKTTPSNAKYIRFDYKTEYVDIMQLEKGETATTYEPYINQTTTISLGQTVYGGEVDVVNGGGKSTHNIVDLGAFNWKKQNESGFYTFYVESPWPSAKITAVLCSNYVYSGTNSHATLEEGQVCWFNNVDKQITIRDTSYEDAAEFKAAMSGVQLVYELATPTTLTTQPTPIKSLNGQNNLSVDCGDVIEGEYFKAL